ncbi:5587_t:CDS:2 [Dentiscutata erythropus]|uniref:5587_t:CDS:1 n=1 Tax=Dentiscutata erythropus TaxID=1348616 RepID=A0A9N9FGH4_9GLOM|nr:5587_t:CDS:2 [Dentiscutata erythropus]
MDNYEEDEISSNHIASFSPINNEVKRKPSFVRPYFEKTFDEKGEPVQICKILNDNGDRYDQKYYNIGSSTGNLIAHLRDIHHIVNNDENGSEPKPKRICFIFFKI